MKRSRKFLFIVLSIASLVVLGIIVWDRQNRAWFESDSSASQPVVSAAPQVTNDVIVAVGSFDFAEPNNRFPQFTESLARYLESNTNQNVIFVDRATNQKSAPT